MCGFYFAVRSRSSILTARAATIKRSCIHSSEVRSKDQIQAYLSSVPYRIVSYKFADQIQIQVHTPTCSQRLFWTFKTKYFGNSPLRPVVFRLRPGMPAYMCDISKALGLGNVWVSVRPVLGT